MNKSLEMNKTQERVPWSYYDKYKELELDKKYFVPTCDDFRNKADQAYCSVSRLIYKWYNDGDIYDNRYGLGGWCNDISSFANWLYRNIPEVRDTLKGIEHVRNKADYENLLKSAFEIVVSKLEELSTLPVEGDVLECNGPFKFYDSYDRSDYDW